MMLTAAVAAAAAKADDYNSFKPGETDLKAPTAVEWQNKNDRQLAEATSCKVLASLVADASSARILLAKLRGAYQTDPMVMMQVGALSQWVLEDDCGIFWKTSRKAQRRIWVKALIETAETAVDDDIRMICLDQLRWCGCSCRRLVSRVYGVGCKSGSKAVEDFAAMVARELERRVIGI